MSQWDVDPERSYRPRPVEVDPTLNVLYDLPDATGGALPNPGTPRHPAYTSGHSTYAGAASEVCISLIPSTKKNNTNFDLLLFFFFVLIFQMLAYFFPRYRKDLDDLADNVGVARLWGGIHWRSDHLRGVELGRAVSRRLICKIEANCFCPTPPTPPQELPRLGEVCRCFKYGDYKNICCEEEDPDQEQVCQSSAPLVSCNVVAHCHTECLHKEKKKQHQEH